MDHREERAELRGRGLLRGRRIPRRHSEAGGVARERPATHRRRTAPGAHQVRALDGFGWPRQASALCREGCAFMARRPILLWRHGQPDRARTGPTTTQARLFTVFRGTPAGPAATPRPTAQRMCLPTPTQHAAAIVRVHPEGQLNPGRPYRRDDGRNRQDDRDDVLCPCPGHGILHRSYSLVFQSSWLKKELALWHRCPRSAPRRAATALRWPRPAPEATGDGRSVARSDLAGSPSSPRRVRRRRGPSWRRRPARGGSDPRA